jgi:hypothetical protein
MEERRVGVAAAMAISIAAISSAETFSTPKLNDMFNQGSKDREKRKPTQAGGKKKGGKRKEKKKRVIFFPVSESPKKSRNPAPS